MKTATSLLATAMTLFSFCALADSAPSATFATNFLHPKDWAFEKNMGQLAAPSGKALPEIKYYGSFAGVHMYCTANRLSFVFTKTTRTDAKRPIMPKIPGKFATPAKTNIVASRLDLEFEGSNPNVEIIAGEKQEMTVNYATARAGNGGIHGVPFYKELTYVNIYPNIDMVATATSQGLEYRFIVHPGGKVEDIKMLRKGGDAMQMLTNGGIKYTTALGTLEESKPQTFMGNKTIGSGFIKNADTLSFKTEGYDPTNDLVIDPGLTWATYFGSDSDDEAYSIALDDTGNVYITGLTNSPTGIATNGVYQTTLTGGADYDVFAAKFSSVGKLIWATYYGGDSSDYASGCALDNNGNLYVTGYTLSDNGIATKGAYQTSLAGSYGYYDMFLAKFNNSGGLLWGTYFGGDIDEYSYAIAVDASDNAYIVGWTGSTSGIATKGSYQTSYGGGTYDAYIAKFSGAGALTWATYFGGKADEFGLGIALDASKNVYITGQTTSTNGIATSGAYKSSGDPISGSAYLAAFDSSGVEKWATYFGGYGNGDIGFSVNAKINGHVYLTGTTGNNSGVATSGAYQTSLGGATDVFLADFSTKGTLNWGTYYGGQGDDAAYGISSDVSGNIYLTGETTSSNQIATTGAYLDSYGSYFGTAFLAKFNSKGILQYGTYYGGSIYDEARCVTNDNSGNIYITGLSASDGIATAGTYQTSNAGEYDAFIAKFLLCNLKTSFTGPASTCANSKTSYIAPYRANSTYVWTVTGGTLKSGNGTDSIAVAWGGGGTGSINEKEVNLTGCLDSATLPVSIGTLPPPPVSGDTVVCPMSTSVYKVSSVSGSTYSWSATGGNIKGASDADSAVVTWPSSAGKGSITIMETYASGCGSSDSVPIRIGALPAPTIIGDTVICAGMTSTYRVTAISGGTYDWTVSGGTILGGSGSDSIVVSWPSTSGTGSVSIAETNASGCQSSNTVSVTIMGPLSPPHIIGDTEVCGSGMSFYHISADSGYSYMWTVNGGSWTSYSNDSIKVAWPIASGTGTVVIKATNVYGCQATTSLPITVNASPTPSIIGGATVCATGSSLFYIKPVSGSTYAWTATGGNITAADNKDSITVSWQASSGQGYVYVTETNISGCRAIDSLPVSIAVLSSPVISGPLDICTLTSSTYHVASVAGVAYAWAVTGGSPSSLPGRDSLIVFWPSNPGKGTVAVTLSSTTGGCKTGDTVNVAIEAAPDAHIMIADTGKGVYTFKAIDSSGTATDYKWVIGGESYTGYHVLRGFSRDSTYHIRLTVTSAAGCTNSFDTTVAVADAGILADKPGTLGVRIYPNPFMDETEIHYSLKASDHVEISVCDMLGRNLATLQDKDVGQGDHSVILDGKANHLTPGIYLVKVVVNGSMETQRVVKVKD